MILNLMRVSMVNVEEMMSMSFKEFGSRFRMQKNKEDLALLEEKVKEKVEQIQDTDVLFENFYDEAKRFFEIRDSYMVSPMEKSSVFSFFKNIFLLNQSTPTMASKARKVL